jgi:hypothetical protein
MFAHPSPSRTKRVKKRDQGQETGEDNGQDSKRAKGGGGGAGGREQGKETGHCAKFLTATAKTGKGACPFDDCKFKHGVMTEDEARAQCDEYLESAKELPPKSRGAFWAARFKY